jgi:hypothetical protein|tara:strand:+ start:434 stop:607 length:174 start_codon:yes stop_codon:yes gene_type:complete
MRLETILTQLYVNAYLTKSRRVEKVINRVKDQQDNTKHQVRDTKAKPSKKGLVDISI